HSHFLKQAPKNQMTALIKISNLEGPRRFNLRKEVFGTHNGAGNQMRKISHEKRIITKTPGGLDFPLVNTKNITHRFKGIKGYAYRQNHMQITKMQSDSAPFQKMFKAGCEKVEVLKKTENEQVDQQTDGQKQLSSCQTVRFFDLDPANEIGCNRNKHQNQKTPVP
ncbi:MAG: hypothetical protein WCW31_04365, partial [Patescibacteria group bacterium]